MPQRKVPGKKERYEILFEEINAKQDLILEEMRSKFDHLGRQIEGFRSEVNDRFTLVEQALKEVSQWVKTHEETHAG